MEREDMADKGDTVFFAGYGSVIIILGLVIFMYSMELFDAMYGFGFWLLFTSFVLIGLGTVRTRDAPSGSPILIGTGVFFMLVSVVILGIIAEVLTPLTAFALFILVIGLAIVGMGLMRKK
jgi:hypothetical protein